MGNGIYRQNGFQSTNGYGFFDYKYNIPDYAGQDYDSYWRYVYLGVSVGLIILLLILFRKAGREGIQKYLRVLGIGMIALYLGKTIWESYFDITTGRGFNEGILPLDTCSIIMLAAPLAGFGKGKVAKLGAGWLATGSVVGGISNLLFLQALNYYPFFTFGAFYSMIWHFLMVFTGLLLLVTNYVEASFKTVLHGFILHMLFSVIVIPFDYIRKADFMLYYMAGGVPLISAWGEALAAKNLHFVTTIIMVIAYFGSFSLIVYVTKAVKWVVRRAMPVRKEKAY